MLVTRSCSRRFPLRLRFPRSQSTIASPEHGPRKMGVFEPPPMPDMNPKIKEQLKPPLLYRIKGWYATQQIPKITFYHVLPSQFSRMGLNLLETAHSNAARSFVPLRFTLEVCPAPPPAETLREFMYFLGSGSPRELLEPTAQKARAVPSFDALYKLVEADPMLLNAPIVSYQCFGVKSTDPNLGKTQLFLGADGPGKVIQMLESLRRERFGEPNLKLLKKLAKSKTPKPKTPKRPPASYGGR
ncbi:hypothetical protein C8F04DRAFT_1244858 [Mycena alexandri]|uniref:Uncharacterized protein n=1 Tax=Mycena alexandri TaxID=1745969 RepID=A0AAD6RWE6_9AGAR|nr:hypothetical protein C8F04DRAFT_1244858 [Mycena alexandri]